MYQEDCCRSYDYSAGERVGITELMEESCIRDIYTHRNIREKYEEEENIRRSDVYNYVSTKYVYQSMTLSQL